MTRTAWSGCAGLVVALAGAASGQVQKAPVQPGRTMAELPIVLNHIPVLRVGPNGRLSHWLPPPTDTCNVVASLTDASFTGGNYIVEAGFAETEMAAATYTVAASEFPIKINLAEVLLGTSNATVQTVTQWSLLFYSGTPNTGTLIDTFSSDDVILPHARVGPGTSAVNIQFSIDPGDPDQLYIPDNGSHQFTVAFRIDHHNQQSGNPCFTAPPTCCNAFPLADCCTGGSCPSGCTANFPAGNWLNGVNCGSFGCPPNGGWATFSALSSLCRPHGDWVMHATWSGVSCTPGVGACCRTDGTCDSMLSTDCATAGGVYQGDGVTCAQANCPQPSAGCCFSNGACLSQTAASCAQLGGTWLGAGVTCNGSQCPTTGGCCLANGTCTAGLTSSQCVAQNGVFRGVGTTCAGANCPVLTGACCTNNGANCGVLTQSDCATIGGTWNGVGSTCAASCSPPTGACCTNGGANCGLLTQSNCTLIGGTWLGADSTCSSCAAPCYANCDNSTTSPVLNILDFSCFLNRFAANDPYANCDNSTTVPVLNVLDFACFLNKFATGCT